MGNGRGFMRAVPGRPGRVSARAMEGRKPMTIAAPGLDSKSGRGSQAGALKSNRQSLLCAVVGGGWE